MTGLKNPREPEQQTQPCRRQEPTIQNTGNLKLSEEQKGK